MLPSTKGKRGYALIAVIVFTILILTGSTVVLVLARDKAIATQLEKKTAEAHGIAVAGINWMVANLDNATYRPQLDALKDLAPPASDLMVMAGPDKRVWKFDRDHEFGGVGVTPPAIGTSNENWEALGRGHYALLVDRDPLNQIGSAVIRAIAVVGGTQVLLESNMTVNLTQAVPAAFTACLGTNAQIEMVTYASPTDFMTNFRFDGNGGLPIASSKDANRMNGLTKADGANPPVFGIGTLPQGRQWRGMQSLRSATINEAMFGGTQATSGVASGDVPDPDWTRNPAITNDPRIVDRLNGTFLGLGLGNAPGSFVFDGATVTTVADATVNTIRAVPLIAFANPLEDDVGLIYGEAEWDGNNDALARGGFYGCGSSTNNTDAAEVVSECLTGVINPLGGAVADPDWDKDDAQTSGLAWGVVQSVLRQCTGSGSSIDPANGTAWRSGTNPNGVACAPGFEYLENIAACLVLPREIVQNELDLAANGGVYRGDNAARDALANMNAAVDGAGLEDDFNGCHPGCLIAVDAANDNGSVTDGVQQEDRPFRSVCINLDPTRTTAYGPGIINAKDTDFNAATFETFAPYGTPSSWELWLSDSDLNGSPTGAAVTAMELSTPATSKAARFVFASGAAADVRTGGAVAERGSPHFITRLDMTDRGPMGTCEQNCIAYGYGKDVTYPATERVVPGPPMPSPIPPGNLCVATVPAIGGGTTTVHCNFDYDHDGFLDRKSYAIASSYDERCVDDGLAWAPAFNIADTNANIMPVGTGCVNNVPNFAAGFDGDADGYASPGTVTIQPFCDSATEQELRDNIDSIIASATIVTPGDLTVNSLPMADGRGWFGGARCHMGAASPPIGAPDTPLHPHSGLGIGSLPDTDTDIHGHRDWWIEDTCPDPVVLRMRANANVNMGYTCGCGILVLDRNTLQFNDNDAFLWRGIIIFNMKTGGTQNLEFKGVNRESSFIIEGAMIAYGDGIVDFDIDKQLNEDRDIVDDDANDGHVQISWRLNQQAINDALRSAPTPIRFLRRVR